MSAVVNFCPYNKTVNSHKAFSDRTLSLDTEHFSKNNATALLTSGTFVNSGTVCKIFRQASSRNYAVLYPQTCALSGDMDRYIISASSLTKQLKVVVSHRYWERTIIELERITNLNITSLLKQSFWILAVPSQVIFYYSPIKPQPLAKCHCISGAAKTVSINQLLVPLSDVTWFSYKPFLEINNPHRLTLFAWLLSGFHTHYILKTLAWLCRAISRTSTRDICKVLISD